MNFQRFSVFLLIFAKFLRINEMFFLLIFTFRCRKFDVILLNKLLKFVLDHLQADSSVSTQQISLLLSNELLLDNCVILYCLFLSVR